MSMSIRKCIAISKFCLKTLILRFCKVNLCGVSSQAKPLHLFSPQFDLVYSSALNNHDGSKHFVPAFCTNLGLSSIAHKGPKLWNTIPYDIRKYKTMKTFSVNFKKAHLFEKLNDATL